MKLMLMVVTIAALFFLPHAFGDERAPNVPMIFDRLRNNSRLTDEQLRYGFERFMMAEMAKTLDLDCDGVADFTGVEVYEFLERMKIILGDRKPFVYKVRPWEQRESSIPGWVGEDPGKFDI